MAVIPKDAVQMPPPRAASPGLPPVDPVTRPAAQDELPNARNASRAGASIGIGEAQAREDSAPTKRPEQIVRGTPLSGSAVLGQENGPPEPEQIVAGEEEAGSSGDPFPAVLAIEPGKSIPPRERPERTGRPIALPILAKSGLLDTSSEAYGHSMEPATKDGAIDPCRFEAGTVSGAMPTARAQAGPQSLDVDSIGLPEFSASDEPASRSTRMPPRIVGRPRAEEWTDDELLTLPEAAALFWPAGPITTNTLRTAGRDGSLAITKVAGKFFTTPMAIRRMGVDETGTLPGPIKSEAASAQTAFQQKLDEARRLGRERKRRQRAAKRPVAPAVSGRAGQ